MSGSDAYQDDMGLFTRRSDRDLERALSGKGPAGSDELEALASFAQKAKATLAAPPSDDVAARHLAAMAEVARATDTAELASSPPGGPSRATPRRKPLFGLFASLTAKIVAGSVAVFATTGGLAAVGELPDPLQRVAADVARAVGLEIDDPDEPKSDDIIVPVSDDDDGETTDLDDDETGKVDNNDDADNDDADDDDEDDDGDDDGNEGRDDEHGRGGGNNDQGKGNDDQQGNDNSGPGNGDDADKVDDDDDGNEGRDDEHGRGGGNNDQGKGNDDQQGNDNSGPGNGDDADKVDDDDLDEDLDEDLGEDNSGSDN